MLSHGRPWGASVEGLRELVDQVLMHVLDGARVHVLDLAEARYRSALRPCCAEPVPVHRCGVGAERDVRGEIGRLASV